MACPSQNIDQRLLAAGLALLPETGCRGLSAVLAELIAAAPLPQALAFLGGAAIAPVPLGSALIEQSVIPDFLAGAFEANVLSESAAAQRIGFALRGLAPVEKG